MTPGLQPDQPIRVRQRCGQGHVRTPAYLRGRKGRILDVAGPYPDPTRLAEGELGLPYRMLYRVVFRAVDVWQDYAGPAEDEIIADLYEHWLEASGDENV